MDKGALLQCSFIFYANISGFGAIGDVHGRQVERIVRVAEGAAVDPWIPRVFVRNEVRKTICFEGHEKRFPADEGIVAIGQHIIPIESNSVKRTTIYQAEMLAGNGLYQSPATLKFAGWVVCKVLFFAGKGC
ncbi:hypothetical protein DXN04_14030 [Chitinophaga silvisoli]|uniref:Uncharacterized protein n=1 Tax=Chitinophaga silvisoli TaxID=2291814 RepID=A0A3E1P2I2_9BACT|nr:hypothetical protein DXN04_14030 [Chitinophaga silvisoli]